MTTANVRKPTKKAFHFPTSPDAAQQPEQEQPEAATPAASADTAKTRRAKPGAKTSTKRSATKANTKAGKKASTKATTKASTKAAAKPGAKTRTKAAAPAAEVAQAPAQVAETPAPKAAGKEKTKRAKKEKVVRDSFTMPKADYERISVLKRKCLDAGVAVKKSELLRAGLQLLESASAKRLLAAIAALEAVKTGRPSQSE
ncbi:hypothetical protein ACFSHT_35795 [Paraburkholderia silviterrae]|uniref:Uncharacterized protein n=1 Tax=Paraburkholderia silviterrae TaxID=2528715 RepID=A0A4V2ZYT7_9BURK|nr:hypothetical protein [Paraburkholderia silviterrae]TDG21989.1 hypothetical protein EYW47_19040 [Paraburkholderia silviterrae]